MLAMLLMVVLPGAGAAGGPVDRAAILGMSEAQLRALYGASRDASLPSGWVRGTPLVGMGRTNGAWVSRGARVVWQGKILKPAQGKAMNRFFGVPSVPAAVYRGTSWEDGGPAAVLDYRGTSYVYRKYRDEIRRVGPGLYLGVMHDATVSPPARELWFLIEAR